ncbi:hypothetical protein B0H10DRAFT_2268149 [Mycena sp. CBHHK59/15]|nr:hypothetical protein B0H10DRAFT_2268149 [Mycena sp. CBHHK59/15]
MSVFAEVINADPPLLPRLRTITLSAVRDNFDYEALLYILRVRRKPSGPETTLASCQLGFYGGSLSDWPPDDVILAQFNDLIAQGLKVRLSYYDNYWPVGRTGFIGSAASMNAHMIGLWNRHMFSPWASVPVRHQGHNDNYWPVGRTGLIRSAAHSTNTSNPFYHSIFGYQKAFKILNRGQSSSAGSTTVPSTSASATTTPQSVLAPPPPTASTMPTPQPPPPPPPTPTAPPPPPPPPSTPTPTTPVYAHGGNVGPPGGPINAK